MRRILLYAICLGCITLTFAAGNTATVSWIAPVAYSDGSSLPAADIDHYTVTWAPVTGQTGPGGSTNIPASSTSTTITVPCGSTSFSVSATTSSTARYPNATSAPDGPVPYATGIACAPNPPAGLAVH